MIPLYFGASRVKLILVKNFKLTRCDRLWQNIQRKMAATNRNLYTNNLNGIVLCIRSACLVTLKSLHISGCQSKIIPNKDVEKRLLTLVIFQEFWIFPESSKFSALSDIKCYKPSQNFVCSLQNKILETI